MRNIADLLEEVHILVQTLLAEKATLEDRIKTLEDEVTKAVGTKNSLTRELQETREKLSHELQVTKEKLDHVYPEMRSLQNALEKAEVQTNLLMMDLQRKDSELEALELRLSEYTSLMPAPLHLRESI